MWWYENTFISLILNEDVGWENVQGLFFFHRVTTRWPSHWTRDRLLRRYGDSAAYILGRQERYERGTVQIHFNCEREKETGEEETSLRLFLHLQVKTENKTTAELKNNSFRTERSTQ